MTREEAIEILWRYDVNFEPHPPEEVMHAIDMAIEALQFVEHFDLLKEFQSLQEVVRCKDCKWYMRTDHNETEVCTNKQWDISMAIYPIISADDFCSYGERGEE